MNPTEPQIVSPKFFPISREELPGAIVVNVFAILSTLALFSVIVRIIWLAARKVFAKQNIQSREYVFFNTVLGYYAGCLLAANMFNSVAGLMGLPDLVNGGLTEDMLCVAQAAVMQFGNISTAYYTAAIAAHTFNSLVLRKRHSNIVYACWMIFGWIFSGLIAILPIFFADKDYPIYGVDGLSCGVNPLLSKDQFLFHLLPIFVTAVICAILYSFIFLVLRGTLIMKGGIKVTLDPQQRWSGQPDEYHRFVFGIARSMLWYPVAYIVFLVPYSVTRMLQIAGFNVPFEALIFAYVCWFTLGVANVILLYNTFRILGPAFDGKISAGQSDNRIDIESFGTTEEFVTEKPNIGPLNRSLYPERVVSISSYYNYSSDIGRPIVSKEEFNMLTESPINRTPSPSESTTSTLPSTSLPLPPRRFKQPSPVSSYQSAVKPLKVVNTVSVQAPPEVHRRSDASSVSQELDITGWLSRQNSQGDMPRGIKNMPLLSAVTPSFPAFQSSPPPSLRPLVLPARIYPTDGRARGGLPSHPAHGKLPSVSSDTGSTYVYTAI